MDAIQEILAKRLTDSPLAESEEQVLANWLREPANADEFAELSRVWAAAGKISYKMNVDIDEEWNQFRNRVSHRVIRHNFVWAVSIAASVALLVGLFMLAPAKSDNLFKYESGSVAEMVVLPDSSTVWLNKNSKIAYKYNSQKHSRSVALSGEAMFKVRHTGDEFVVKTPQKVFTKVLGTVFNLSAYADAKTVELAVVEGKVAFGSRKNSAIVVKGQQATFDCKAKTVAQPDSLDNNVIGWHTGTFNYDNKPLEQIVKQLGSYLNRQIILPKEARNVQYSGKFDHPTAESVAEIISTAMNWNYKITDTEIIFSQK